jgi:hypothetical protein
LLDAVNPDNSLIPRLGVLAIDLTPDLSSRLGDAANSLWSRGGRPCRRPDHARHRLEAGDIIHQLNIHTDRFHGYAPRPVGALKSGDPVVLQVERDGGLLYVSFELE